jgi:putative ATP-binding cassette transporter
MERMDAEKEPLLLHTLAAPRGVLSSDSVIAQLMTLVRALAGSRRRRQLGLLALGVGVVICANAAGQIRLNIWQRDFYEAIEQRDVPAFITQLMVFAVIAGGLLVLVVSQTWLRAMTNVRLREWLTHDLRPVAGTEARLHAGLRGRDRRQSRSAHPAGCPAPDRPHDHSRNRPGSVLAASPELCGRAWVLSNQVVFDFGNGPVTIPGYMVWCAAGRRWSLSQVVRRRTIKRRNPQ